MSETLPAAIASADPIEDREDATLDELVRRMTIAAREQFSAQSAVRLPWWKRRRIVIPLGIAGVVALTGAAVVIPLSLGVNGSWGAPDAEIPIVYTTETGVEVRCRYGMSFGDPADRTEADERLAEFVRNHDWTGIGQRIHDEAIARPFVPGPDDDWEVDTQELRDSFSFTEATSLIWEEIPAALLQQSGGSAGTTTDCTGRLR